jgi:hypothetical protein
VRIRETCLFFALFMRPVKEKVKMAFLISTKVSEGMLHSIVPAIVV